MTVLKLTSNLARVWALLVEPKGDRIIRAEEEQKRFSSDSTSISKLDLFELSRVWGVGRSTSVWCQRDHNSCVSSRARMCSRMVAIMDRRM